MITVASSFLLLLAHSSSRSYIRVPKCQDYIILVKSQANILFWKPFSFQTVHSFKVNYNFKLPVPENYFYINMYHRPSLKVFGYSGVGGHLGNGIFNNNFQSLLISLSMSFSFIWGICVVEIGMVWGKSILFTDFERSFFDLKVKKNACFPSDVVLLISWVFCIVSNAWWEISFCMMDSQNSDHP